MCLMNESKTEVDQKLMYHQKIASDMREWKLRINDRILLEFILQQKTEMSDQFLICLLAALNIMQLWPRSNGQCQRERERERERERGKEGGRGGREREQI
jgi:hypothetical protein